MQTVIYGISGLFVVLSFLMLFAYARTRIRGLLIMSCFYGAGGMLGGYMVSWWPLLAGFASAWLVRVLGMDPDTRPYAIQQAEERASAGPSTGGDPKP